MSGPEYLNVISYFLVLTSEFGIKSYQELLSYVVVCAVHCTCTCKMILLLSLDDEILKCDHSNGVFTSAFAKISNRLFLRNHFKITYM